MRYIFNANGKCVATCDYEPNLEDLASRGEVAVEGETVFQLSEIELINGVITPKAIPPKAIPQPTQAEIIAGYTSQVQSYLDATAKQRNYDNIFTLCGYITDPNPKFQSEAQAAVAWRSAVWTKCYAILADVQAGTRAMPTDIIAELPVMTWGD